MKCELCEREKPLTTHHLLCKSQWSTKYLQKRFTKKEMHNRTIEICKDCHCAVHEFYNEKELARNYNTKELLLASAYIQNFIKWAAKQK